MKCFIEVGRCIWCCLTSSKVMSNKKIKDECGVFHECTFYRQRILYRLLKWKISDDDNIQGSLVGTRYLLYSVLLLALSTFTICKKYNLSHNNYRLDKLYFNNLVFQIPIGIPMRSLRNLKFFFPSLHFVM